MAEISVSHKICYLCRVDKPAHQFYKKTKRKDGLTSRCRDCHDKPRPVIALRQRRFIDLTGQRFGILTAVSVWDVIGDSRKFMWACLCECGNTTVVAGANLTGGRQISCGCIKDAKAAARMYKHGMADIREYSVWCGAKKRCFDESEPSYRNYGGRGITMCPEWAHSFEAFYKYMGARPEGCELDRINNNGNYEPGNCRWATKLVNIRNTRIVIHITHNGETLTLSEWAERTGISCGALHYRHKNNLPLFDSPPRLTENERSAIRSAYALGNETVAAMALRLGVCSQTIYNIIQKTPAS